MVASRSRHFRPLFALASIAFAMLAAACDKVPLTAPTGSTVTLTANATFVPISGTALLTATVTEAAGTAVQNGTVVTFSTTIGTIEPAEARHAQRDVHGDVPGRDDLGHGNRPRGVRRSRFVF